MKEYLWNVKLLSSLLFIVLFNITLGGQILDEKVCAEAKAARYTAWRSQSGFQTLPHLFDITHIKARWQLDPAQRYIAGSVRLTYRALRVSSVFPLELDAALKVDSVKSNAAIEDYEHTAPFNLKIFGSWQVGDTGSLTVYYHGIPPSNGFGSFGMGQNDSGPALWTLSEPYGARDWWPAPQNLKDKVDSLDVIISTPKRYQTGSNGLLISVVDSGSNRIFHWKHRHPIAIYLIAAAAAPYLEKSDTIALRKGPVLVQNMLYPEAAEIASEAINQFYRHFQWMDSLWIPYPFSNEKYGHAQFGWGGGMEHQTMSFMGGFTFELMVHELAHQWFGDYITCASWHDIWLNEGFATYCTMLAYERFSKKTYWPLVLEQTIRSVTSKPGGSVYVEDTSDIGRIFDGRLSYRKGAMLLHMLRWTLGDEHFFSAIRNYLEDTLLANAFAHTDDLKRHLEAVSGLNLDRFFEQWFYGEGYPQYLIRWKWTEGELWIDLTQNTSDPSVSVFEMDLPILVRGASSDTLLRISNTRKHQQYRLSIPFKPQSLQFDPDRWILSDRNEVSEVKSNLWKVSFSLDYYPESVHLISSDPFRSIDVRIFDMSGREIWEKHFENNALLTIDCGAWSPGAYLAIVESEGERKAIKLILP